MALVAGTGSRIGTRIRAAREGARLSQEGLARFLDATPEHIDAIENGAELSTQQLDLIAAALGRDILWFLRDDAPVEAIEMRAGDASPEAEAQAIQVLSDFVRDYEFLRSLE